MKNKETSLEFWKNVGPIFSTINNKDVHAAIATAVSLIPDPCIILDLGGGNFSEHTSSRGIYDILKNEKGEFDLHIADIRSPINEIKKNVFFHEGDLDTSFNNLSFDRINLVTALGVLQEPINYNKILTSLIQFQQKGDVIVIMVTLYFNGNDNTNIKVESLLKGYEVKSFHEGELKGLLESYDYNSRIIEGKTVWSAKEAKDAIERKTGITEAKKKLNNMKTNHPQLIEMRNTHLVALDDAVENIVNYSRFELITAIKK